ncbi:MAG: OsmC family protein [Planctomycetes bacterium]|nr:OsmC family protein [Planctomycetota bacterium]NUQ34610.1 OsmC family protein [Planctomycetaceae bacterium]
MAVEITGTYQGQLTCKAVHGPSGNALTTTAPKDNGGTGEYFSPTDLLATALGTCMMSIMGIWAKARDVNLDGTTFRVEKHMTAKPPRKVEKLVVEFTIPGARVSPDKRESLEHAAHTCPVHLSLHPDVKVETAFRYV